MFFTCEGAGKIKKKDRKYHWSISLVLLYPVFIYRNFRANPLVEDIKERIRQLAIDDKQEGAQDRYIFEEPSSFNQRERTCAKYIGKVSLGLDLLKFFFQILSMYFSSIAILCAIWTMLAAFKNARTD